MYEYIWWKSKNCSDIYVLLTTSGEIYLLSLFLRQIKNSQNIFFVTTRKYHIEILKMILGDVNYLYLPEAFELYFEDTYKTNYKGKIYNKYLTKSFISILYDNWFDQKDKHYISLIKRYIDFKDGLSKEKPELCFSQDVEISLKNKINEIGLNVNKFVYFIPEAKTCKPIDIQFWKDLYEKFSELGYDVYVNSIGQNKEFSFGKYANLSITEANFLARTSKGVVALRSGMCEPFTLIDVPMAVLYTDVILDNNIKIDANTIFQTYTLKKYPYIIKNNLFEYNTNLYSKKELIKCIIINITST